MSTIAVEQRQFTTYILSLDAGTQLEVVPERGGIITRWQVGDRDLLYLDAERFSHPDLSVRGGIPILFPICGNLPNNTYTYNGQSYTLKQHGFARDLPWSVVDQQSQDDSVSLVLSLESNDQTRAVYPFNFLLTFTYRLHGNQLTIHQRYTNRSDELMPFSAGFHPYFAVADKTQLGFDIPGTEYLDQRTQAVHPFNGQFDLKQDEIDVAFRNVTRQTAGVDDRPQALQLRLDYSPQFSTLVFWTIQGKDYYCLEPWTAPRNALNTADHLLYLEPGTSLEMSFNLSVVF